MSGWKTIRLGLFVVASLLFVAFSAQAAGRTFSIKVDPPKQMTVGETILIPVRIFNEGNSRLKRGRNVRLSYRWLENDKNLIVAEGDGVDIICPALPGKSVLVKVRVNVPGELGFFRLGWEIVGDGSSWPGELPPQALVEVVPVSIDHRFDLVEAHVPRLLFGKGRQEYTVAIRNSGTVPWGKDSSIGLAYHWYKLGEKKYRWEGLRTDLPLPVMPGEIVTVKAGLVVPRERGFYRLQWDLVEERVCWFSQKMSVPPPKKLVLATSGSAILVFFLPVLVFVVAVWLWRKKKVTGFSSLADIVWLAVALWIKQSWLMSQTPPHPALGSFWVTTAGVALVVGVVLLFPWRIRPWVALLVGSAWSAVFWMDLLYMRYFGALPSLALLNTVGQTGQVTDSIRSLIQGTDWVLAADFMPALFLVWVVSRRRTHILWRRLFLAVFVLLTIPGIAWTLTGSIGERGAQRFSTVQTAERVGPVGYHMLDVWGWSKEVMWGMTISDRDRDRVNRLFKMRQPLRAGKGPWFGIAQGQNVILLQVESLQGFIVGLRVNGQEVTPTLNRLAAEGVYCSLCTDQTSFGRTSDAELLTEVSLLPAIQGTTCFRHGGNDFMGLADVFRKNGYSTLSAVPFDGGFWNRRVIHPGVGFRKSFFARNFEPGRRIGWGLNDRDFLMQMVPRLHEANRPFIAFLITLSLHHPFEDFPEDLEQLDVGKWEGSPFGGFLQSMRFFDDALESFLAGLEKNGLLANTVLVIWGDHDAGFKWTEENAKAQGHRNGQLTWLLEDRVPLIFSIPGHQGPNGKRIDDPTGLWDVAPTVSSLVGIDPGSLPWLGRNLGIEPLVGPVVRPKGEWIGKHLLWTGSENQKCYDWRTLKQVSATECGEGTRSANEIAEINDLVLKANLQQSIVVLPGR